MARFSRRRESLWHAQPSGDRVDAGLGAVPAGSALGGFLRQLEPPRGLFLRRPAHDVQKTMPAANCYDHRNGRPAHPEKRLPHDLPFPRHLSRKTEIGR